MARQISKRAEEDLTQINTFLPVFEMTFSIILQD